MGKIDEKEGVGLKNERKFFLDNREFFVKSTNSSVEVFFRHNPGEESTSAEQKTNLEKN